MFDSLFPLEWLNSLSKSSSRPQGQPPPPTTMTTSMPPSSSSSSSSSQTHPVIAPYPAQLKSLRYKTNIPWKSLTVIQDPTSLHLVVSLPRHARLSTIVNRPEFLLIIPHLNLMRTLNRSHLRYDKVFVVRAPKNYTQIVFDVPDFQYFGNSRELIGVSEQDIEVLVCTLDSVVSNQVPSELLPVKRPAAMPPPPPYASSGLAAAMIAQHEDPRAKRQRVSLENQENACVQGQVGVRNNLSAVPPVGAASNVTCVPSIVPNAMPLLNNFPLPPPPVRVPTTSVIPSIPTQLTTNSVSSRHPAPTNSVFSSNPVSFLSRSLPVSAPSLPPPPVIPSRSNSSANDGQKAVSVSSHRHVRLQVNMPIPSISSSRLLLSPLTMCMPLFDRMLQYLTVKDRLKCRLVCDSWRRLVDSSNSWRVMTVNTQDLCVARTRKLGDPLPAYISKCQQLHVHWECNTKDQIQPIQEVQSLLTSCVSLRSLSVLFFWSAENEKTQVNRQRLPIHLSMESILKALSKVSRLSLNVMPTESCVIVWESTPFSNTFITRLEVENIHRMPSLLQLQSANLPNLRTLHFRAFHLCRVLTLLKLNHIEEIILECDGHALQMKEFDWLLNMTQLKKVSVLKVVYSPNLMNLMTALGKLNTLTQLTLYEEVPYMLMKTNDALVQQLPPSLLDFKWHLTVLSSQVDGALAGSATTGPCIEADEPFLRCLVQARLKNRQADIWVTVHDPDGVVV